MQAFIMVLHRDKVVLHSRFVFRAVCVYLSAIVYFPKIDLLFVVPLSISHLLFLVWLIPLAQLAYLGIFVIWQDCKKASWLSDCTFFKLYKIVFLHPQMLVLSQCLTGGSV